jgi:hypothetical protein
VTSFVKEGVCLIKKGKEEGIGVLTKKLITSLSFKLITIGSVL